MSALSEYIRNIAIFLIFASFITIIIPGKKFQPYINMVLGVVLIFIITMPLAGVIAALSNSSGDIFADINIHYDRAVLARQISQAEEAQIDMILDAYRQSLTEQLSRIIDSHGHYSLVAADIDIDRGANFGEILSITARVTETAASPPPLVQIDRVRIDMAVNTRGEPQPPATDDVENPHIMSLKIAIAHFYNLGAENILLLTDNNQ